MILINGFPRRNNTKYFTALEWEMWNARQAIERGPAHPLLTEASELVRQAQEKIADHAELEESFPKPATVFHITETGFAVSVNGEMATAEQLDGIAQLLNNSPNCQFALAAK